MLIANLNHALAGVVGKTIKGVVLSEGLSPSVQWHLVFTDGTVYEFFADGAVQGGSQAHKGGIAEIRAIGKRDGRSVTVFA